MATNTSQVWFVTGSSSGLGKAVVKYVLQQGAKVVATLRKPEALADLASKYPASQLLVVKLDVTSPSDIIAAFAKAVSHFGRVDVVYNNAGYGALAEIEGTPDEAARGLFEVNFWGAANVAREAVRVFRDVNKPAGGRLLHASSVAGVNSIPGIGYYSASKFALEGLSEALSKEVHPSWNIKITIIEFGGFATGPTGSMADAIVVIPEHPAYSAPDNATKIFRGVLSGPLQLADPNKAARELFKIAEDDTVGLRVPLGQDAIAVVKEKHQELETILETTAKWSVDLK